MKVETWVRVSTVFQEALLVPLGERGAFLERACGEDVDVRAEVERLLRLDDAAGEPFEQASVLRSAVGALIPGMRVGSYTIVRAIASGGMGTVYEAVQENPRRTVALKTMHLGLAAPERVQRFLFEAETLGRLQHPSIAQIYEAGTHGEGGQRFPFFAMELVAGARDLLAYARDEGLSLAARLQLFQGVCAAVHHGHQKGVVHRDLKAANILVDAEGRPKIIDFGVARCSGLFDAPRATQAGELVGTLATMSPEQLSGRPEDVDARSDVYALGVVLCELASGAPPYDLAGLSLEEAVRRVREAAPRRAPEVPRELHWILLRALEKDPDRRYGSASDLGEDLRRFLAREPVSAGPPGMHYALAKLARRHRVLLAATGAVIAALAIGLARAERSARAESRARADAVREARRARVVGDTLDRILTSSAPQHDGSGVAIEDVLREAARVVPEVTAEDPAAGAALHKTIGASYAALHRPAEAEPHLAAARAFALEHLERDDPLALEIQAAWAFFLLFSERNAEAEQVARELVPLAERKLGPDDPQTFGIRATLGAALFELDRLDEAESVALENLQRVHGDKRAIPLLIQLGTIAWRRGSPEEMARARRLAEQALDLCLELLSPEHMHAIEARQLLALIASDEGRGADVGSSMDAALSEGRSDLSQSACMALAVVMQQGMEAQRTGDHAASHAAYAKAREESDRLYGAETLYGVSARNSLALACLDLGRASEAVGWAEEAIAIAARVLPSDHRTALKSRATAAFSQAEDGRPAEAEARFRALLPEAERVFGPADPFVLEIVISLAEALAAQGDAAGVEEQAAELARRAPEATGRAERIAALLEALRFGGPDDPAAATDQ